MSLNTPTRPAARPTGRPRITVPKLTPEQGERIRAVISALLKRVRDAFRTLARLAREAADAIGRAAASVTQLASTLRAARRDRPAWASPYGPAPRPHRSRG
ncbi:hypothetical protein [Streptomyces longwoodensis]|uniref:hypothetical protein n=1 Tax=Streptomyces longwoodensis TaxID=68231 RepID=UPI0036F9729B